MTACLTPLMAYQSDSEAPKRRLKLPKLPLSIATKVRKTDIPTSLAAAIPATSKQKLPQNDETSQQELADKDANKPKSPREQLLLDLFSCEKESARLTSRQK